MTLPTRDRGARALRWVVPIASVAASCALALILELRPAVATASHTTGRYTLAYTAENLLDGSLQSFWLAGARQAVVTVRLPRTRSFAWIEVVNGDNAPHRDHGTGDFRVELYEGHHRRFNARSSFAEVSTEARRFDVAGARGDRIRVAVESAHALGACLAEITWDGR